MNSGQKMDGKRVELFGKVYEWAWDPNKLSWGLERVWTDEKMDLIAEMMRAMGAGDVDAMNDFLQRLNDLGVDEFGTAPDAMGAGPVEVTV